jgi:CRISPR system Cascade subunit CasC
MFIEMHTIQSFAPANLNRDDTNNPKDCEFGGVRRARISSQCIKRAIRTCPEFERATQVKSGERSRRMIAERLQPALVEAGKGEEEAKQVLAAFVPSYLSKLDKDGERTAVLLYLSQEEIDTIRDVLLSQWDALLLGDKKAMDGIARELSKRFSSHSSAPDIALFGRMLAERPELNLEAACQVAHAISTHRVTMEMDFFTAVDDLQESAEPGAGMMGFTGYNSACFYRYARIDWEQLVRNLSGDAALAARAVEGFLRASVMAVPTGKQNSFAAQNPPSFLLGVVRKDGMSWSLANAFERPVRARGDSGLVQPSVEALSAYWERLTQVYGRGNTDMTVAALALEGDLELGPLARHKVETLEEWVKAVLAPLPSEEAAA